MNPHRLAAFLLGGILGWGGAELSVAQTVLVTPSVTVGEEYDDNVRRSSTNRQSDFITSVTPGLGLQVRTHPWYVTLAASLRGEFFAKESELNNFGDNALGNATVEFRPTPTLTLSLADSLARSFNPFDIDPVTGLSTTGRSISTNNTVMPAMSYQVNPLTTLRLRYSLRTFRSDSPRSLDSDTHTAEASMERQLTRRDSATFRYTYNHFKVEGSPDVDSHLPRVGIGHAFSPTIRTSAEAGPLIRLSADGTELTVGGTLRYEQQFKQGALSIVLDRSTQLAGAIGQASVANRLTTTTNFPITSTLTLVLDSIMSQTESTDTTPELRIFSNSIALNYQPLRSLSVAVRGTRSDTETPGENRTSGRAVDFQAYSAGIQASYVLLRWLTIQVGYRLESQDDRVGTNDLRRNVFFLRLMASDQFRAH